MENKTLVASNDAPELVKMMTLSTSAESQFSRSKPPRRNAFTGLMLMKSAVLAASESLHSLPIPFDKTNHSTVIGNTTCPTPLIPVVPDANLHRRKLPLKRSLEYHRLESGYDGNCNGSDLRLDIADALESHLGGISLRKPKKRRVSNTIGRRA
jgi:hypothetical protein